VIKRVQRGASASYSCSNYSPARDCAAPPRACVHVQPAREPWRLLPPLHGELLLPAGPCEKKKGVLKISIRNQLFILSVLEKYFNKCKEEDHVLKFFC
jgi:hypothetical protein